MRESPIDEVGGGMVKKKDWVIGAEDPKHSTSALPGKENASGWKRSKKHPVQRDQRE